MPTKLSKITQEFYSPTIMNWLCPADGRNKNNGSSLWREVIHYVPTYIGNDNRKGMRHEMIVKNVMSNHLEHVVQIKTKTQLTVVVAKISKGGIHIRVYSSWDGQTYQSVTMANYCDLATALHPKQSLLWTIPSVAMIEDGKRLVDNTRQMQHHVVSLITNHDSEVNEIQPISVVNNSIHNNGTLYKVKTSGNFHVDKRRKQL
jgi:hypothetical protein